MNLNLKASNNSVSREFDSTRFHIISKSFRENFNILISFDDKFSEFLRIELNLNLKASNNKIINREINSKITNPFLKTTK